MSEPRTSGIPEEWILDAVDAWHEAPRNENDLALLDDEMAFVLSRVAPKIADQARAEGATAERARIVARFRELAAMYRAVPNKGLNLGQLWHRDEQAREYDRLADAIEKGGNDER